jgi:hypothetical protein
MPARLQPSKIRRPKPEARKNPKSEIQNRLERDARAPKLGFAGNTVLRVRLSFPANR